MRSEIPVCEITLKQITHGHESAHQSIAQLLEPMKLEGLIPNQLMPCFCEGIKAESQLNHILTASFQIPYRCAERKKKCYVMPNTYGPDHGLEYAYTSCLGGSRGQMVKEVKP